MVGVLGAPDVSDTPGLTVNDSAPEVPPPGPGVTTVKLLGVPAVVRLAAVITAVSCVALTKVVASGTPFRLTTDPATKPVPVMVTVVAGLPAGAEFGPTLARVGAGFATTNVSAADAVPLAFRTTTDRLPVFASAAAGMTAASCVGLTKVVAIRLPLTVTTESGPKFAPISVTVVSGPPTMAVAGVRLVTVGAGSVIVSVLTAFWPRVAPPTGVPRVTVSVRSTPGRGVRVPVTLSVVTPGPNVSWPVLVSA